MELFAFWAAALRRHSHLRCRGLQSPQCTLGTLTVSLSLTDPYNTAFCLSHCTMAYLLTILRRDCRVGSVRMPSYLPLRHLGALRGKPFWYPSLSNV